MYEHLKVSENIVYEVGAKGSCGTKVGARLIKENKEVELGSLVKNTWDDYVTFEENTGFTKPELRKLIDGLEELHGLMKSPAPKPKKKRAAKKKARA